MKLVWKPQVMAAVIALLILGVLGVLNDMTEVVMGCVVGIGALGGQLLERTS